ncbi:RidA family protein [Acidovorax sp. sic0104]|uniref:RidA family protein n=1 Tax=Acidovorax sp. sic0104 TaxID=2854784 RepID=UPI001C46473C|nr:RidA family protein [Acidovorax sp. sic0104]MBV7540559.1 RidA family protein [Acidovorax sp. sic0104]
MNEAELTAGMSVTPQYQYAQRVANQLFVAGQVPHDSQGNLVGAGNAFVQASQCLRNLNLVLTVHDFTLADVRKIVVYVVGEQEQLSAAWKATTEFFAGQVPPATLLGVARLGYAGQWVEVDATVMKT